MKTTRLVMWLVLSAGACAWTMPAAAAQKMRIQFIRADSEETSGEDGKGENAFDGDPDTIWHTQWQDNAPAHPHEIIFELEPPTKIKGISYLPRQGDTENGTIKGYEIYAGLDRENTPLVKKGAFARGREKQFALFDLAEVRRVKLVALSEVNEAPWSSAAEIGVVLEGDQVVARPALSVAGVDSEETAGEDAKGANAVDGNPATFWHTQWQDSAPSCPHEIVLKLDAPALLKGLSYLPRQDSDHGRIQEFEISLSDDGKEFGPPVAKGRWENTELKKTAPFEPKKASFIRLKALSEVNGEPWTSAAEIEVEAAAGP